MATPDSESPEHPRNGLTGVHQAFRNRGIATAVKALVASYAKKQGHSDINASGAGNTQAMLRVNQKLGYEIEPAWITFRAVK